jgi:signal transduction histidine kinase
MQTFEAYLKDARLLIIDDEPQNINLLQSVLTRFGFRHFESTTEPRETLARVAMFQPDLILLDLNMPHLNGVEVLQQLSTTLPSDSYLPVLVLTGETSVPMKRRALANGATDLLPKPYDPSEVFVRMRNLLKTRYLHLAVQGQNAALERQVAERTRSLEETLEELRSTQQQLLKQARLHAFSEMAGGVVHDFNNSLMAVIGYSDLLLGSPEMLDEKETVIEFLEIMNTSGRDAAHVVARLRDFYRPRDISDVFANVEVNDLLEKAVPMTQPKWKDQALAEGRAISLELDLAKLPTISANEAELRELLTNLIFNAVDAMPQGGTITLRSRRCDDGVIFEVADTGAGMSEEVRTRCLEPFFSTKGDSGTGLGLSMVFGIVQRHNGGLDVQSELGKGTTFIIRLPVGTLEEQAAEAKPHIPGRALQILVVDDEPVTRDVVSRFLKMDGHEVTTVKDAPEALAQFAERNFDLMLTDHAMPGMNGLELATAAKIACEEMPIILLTGFGQHELEKDDAITEVDVVINKPVPQSALRRAVSKAIPELEA